MSFNYHVFISYSHPDNLEAGSTGWVTRFNELLEPILTSRLKRTSAKIWRDNRLSDNDVFDPVIMQALPESAVFIAVLSDNYVESPWCQREAQAFCDLAAGNGGLAPGNRQRVFKIAKLPPERLDPLPAPMRTDTNFYKPFFVRADKDRRITKDPQDTPLELDPTYGPEFENELRKNIAILAQDIVDTLKTLGAPGAVAPPVAPSGNPKPTVYLAECAEDRRADRESLRGALVQAGYQVLPDRELPVDEEAYRVEVARLLERSALSVHLLGTSPGSVPDGPGMDSDLVIQNALAVERATAGSLRRVVSLPDGTVCKRPIHQQFLDAITSQAAVLGPSAELIDGGYQKLLKEVQDTLKLIEKPPPAPPPAAPTVPGASAQTGESAGRLKLYVIFVEPDFEDDACGNLRDALDDQVDVLKPVFEGTPEEKREAAKQRLTECDAVLLYYGAGTDGWRESVLSEIRQAAAWRSGRALPVLQWIGGPSTRVKRDELRKTKPNIVNALDGYEPALLTQLLALLSTREQDMTDALPVAPVPPHNPYPGLRPFRSDEKHLFFGRERQVDRMVEKLAAHRFLAVVGGSGSGKSSLVNCGLAPGAAPRQHGQSRLGLADGANATGQRPDRCAGARAGRAGVLFDEPLSGRAECRRAGRDDAAPGQSGVGRHGGAGRPADRHQPAGGGRPVRGAVPFSRPAPRRCAAHGDAYTPPEDALAFVALLLAAAAQTSSANLRGADDALGLSRRLHAVRRLARGDQRRPVPGATADSQRDPRRDHRPGGGGGTGRSVRCW